mgnify:FL=1
MFYVLGFLICSLIGVFENSPVVLLDINRKLSPPASSSFQQLEQALFLTPFNKSSRRLFKSLESKYSSNCLYVYLRLFLILQQGVIVLSESMYKLYQGATQNVSFFIAIVHILICPIPPTEKQSNWVLRPCLSHSHGNQLELLMVCC